MKKITALLLLACMLFSLVACGGNNKTDDRAEVDCWTYDASGNKQYLPICNPEDNITLKVGIAQHANVIDYDTNAYTKWLEEQTGIRVEFIKFSGNSSDITTQISMMIAGGETMPDVFYHMSPISQTTGREYGNQGYFISLNDYFADEEMTHFTREAYKKVFGEEKGMALFNQNITRGTYNKDNQLYPFVTMEEVPFDSPHCHTIINQQWLDKLGLKAPTNIDELYDVLVAFRDKDPNGNGKKDEIPMLATQGSSYCRIVDYLINAFIYKGSSDFNVTDGKVWSAYNTDEYRQALIYIRKLVKEGLLSPLSWTAKKAELLSLINPVDGVYTVGVSAGHGDVYFTNDDSIFVYSPLAPLADATGRGGYGPREYYSTSFSTYITADCKNPDVAFRWLDFQMSEEAYLRQRWGEYGVDWEYSTNPQMTSNSGTEPKIVVHNMNILSEQNNQSWHTIGSVASEYFYSYEMDLTDTASKNTKRVNNIRENYENYISAGLPKDVYWFGSYTEQELDDRQIFATDLTSYITTSRTNFCTGEDDPADDATWNNYVSNLQKMRYDDWILYAQNAYDRVKDSYIPY